MTSSLTTYIISAVAAAFLLVIIVLLLLVLMFVVRRIKKSTYTYFCIHALTSCCLSAYYHCAGTCFRLPNKSEEEEADPVYDIIPGDVVGFEMSGSAAYSVPHQLPDVMTENSAYNVIS